MIRFLARLSLSSQAALNGTPHLLENVLLQTIVAIKKACRGSSATNEVGDNVQQQMFSLAHKSQSSLAEKPHRKEGDRGETLLKEP